MKSEPGRRVLPRVAVVGVFVVFGLLIAASAQSIPADERADRRTDLTALVGQRADEVAALDAQAAAEREQLEADSARLAETDSALAAERSAGDTVAPQAGLSAVRGPAVAVALDDAPAPEPGQPLPVGITYDDLVVHQQDVQAVVNSLWGSGAEAMSIMGQRIVATSAVRCVGNTLILHGRVYSPPYEIVAIGDQTRLQEGLDTDPAVAVYREWAGIVGLGYQVSRTEVELPAYEGPLQLPNAQVTG